MLRYLRRQFVIIPRCDGIPFHLVTLRQLTIFATAKGSMVRCTVLTCSHHAKPLLVVARFALTNVVCKVIFFRNFSEAFCKNLDFASQSSHWGSLSTSFAFCNFSASLVLLKYPQLAYSVGINTKMATNRLPFCPVTITCSTNPPLPPKMASSNDCYSTFSPWLSSLVSLSRTVKIRSPVAGLIRPKSPVSNHPYSSMDLVVVVAARFLLYPFMTGTSMLLRVCRSPMPWLNDPTVLDKNYHEM
jgi:hypothetical protein